MTKEGKMTTKKLIKTLLWLFFFSAIGFFIAFTEIEASINLSHEYLHRVECDAHQHDFPNFDYYENQVDYYKSKYPQSSAGMIPETFADTTEISLGSLLDNSYLSLYISYPVLKDIQERRKWDRINHGNNTDKNLIIALNRALEESSERYSPRRVTLLEIGGNTGWYASIFASKGYSTVSVDPTSHAKLIQKNICQNKATNGSINQIYFLGTRKIDKKCEMIMASKPHAFYFMNHYDWCQGGKNRIFEWTLKQKIKFLTIDRIISTHQAAEKHNIAVVKMDVKGMELDVLKGGQNFFKNTPPLFILIETSKKFTTNNKNQLYTLMLYLTNDLGYRLFEGTQFDNYIPYYDYSNYVQNLQNIPNLYAIHNTYYEVKLVGEYK